MSTPALRKHFELMVRLGVRTVKAMPRDIAEGRTVAKTKELHEKIMALVGKGKCDVEIASELDISPQTAGRHRRGKIKAVYK